MAEKDSKLYIKDIAKMTGLSEQLIRKWEDRYQIIKPERMDNGYRVYSQEDAATLVELKKLRDQNVSIRNAVQMILEKKSMKEIKGRLPQAEPSPYVGLLLDKGAVYDEEGIIYLLKQAHHQYGLELFIQNTVRPFLEEVGTLWGTGEWDESQESVSSLAVKDYLTEIDRHFLVKEDAPHALGFCLPGELHDIPLQMILLQMKMKGWRTTRIAASPKFTAIEKLINHLQPEKVLLSASTLIPFQESKELLQNLDLIAEKYAEIGFYIGGHGAWEYTNIVKPNHLRIAFHADEVIGDKSPK